MFKIIADVASINYDFLLEQAVKSGGAKIPGISVGLLKHLPQSTKNGLIISAFVNEKAKLMAEIEKKSLEQGILVRLRDLVLEEGPNKGIPFRLTIHVESMDYNRANQLILPMLLREEDLKEVFGESYDGSLSLETILEHLQTESEKAREYALLKTLSIKKEVLIGVLEEYVGKNQVPLKVDSVKILMAN